MITKFEIYTLKYVKNTYVIWLRISLSIRLLTGFEMEKLHARLKYWFVGYTSIVLMNRL